MDESGARQQPILLGCVAAGTLVRLIYGYVARPWAAAPDQLAWGLLLDEARAFGLRWDQVAHWPHEGASALLAWPATLLPDVWLGVPALSWTALAADTAGRLVQVLVVHRLFGARPALWFAGWTVFAVPGLIPWGTVNFGLHSVSAFWPFLILLATVGLTGRPGWWRLGVVLGLALSWSYDSLPFVLLGLTTAIARAPRPARVAGAAACAVALLAALLPHALIRLTLDHGFALETYSVVAVRDASFTWPGPLAWIVRTLQVALESVPGATLLPAIVVPGSDVALRWTWTGLAGVGLAGAIRAGGAPRWAAAGVLVFLAAYAASPFHEAALRATEYSTFRHLAFVLPVLGAAALIGAGGGRGGRVVRRGLVALGIVGTLAALAVHRPPPEDWETAGWILARKLGHDPARVERVVGLGAEPSRPALWRGVGWGLTATLLADVVDPADARVDRFVRLLRALDAPGDLRDGIARAFDPDVRPVLLPALRDSLSVRLGPEGFRD